MMRRNIRKAVSVICAVALLLSLCVVSFTGMSSAAPISAEDPTTVTWIPVQNYDFNNESGIAYKRFITAWEYRDDCLYIYNSDTGGGGVWLAKDASCTDWEDHRSATADKKATARENMLVLEAGSTYRITYKYKYLAGSKLLRMEVIFAPDATGVNSAVAPSTSAGIAGFSKQSSSEMSLPDGQISLAEDTDWYNDEIIFTVGSENVNVGIKPVGNSNTSALVDDIVIEKMGAEVPSELNNEYTFDYKEGNTAYDAEAAVIAVSGSKRHYTLSGISGDKGFTPSSIGADGLQFNFVSAGYSLEQSEGNTWHNNAFVYDTDAVEGGMLPFKKDATYLVTVKYKVTDMGSNTEVGLAVAASSKTGGAAYKIGYNTHSAASTDWEYLNVYFTAADSNTQGKYLYLSGRASNGTVASILVESVKVKEVRSNTGVAVIEYVDNGVKTYDVVPAGVATELQTRSANEDVAFGGWYTDEECTPANKVAMSGYVPAVGTTTLYAKWTNIFSSVTFNNCGTVTTEPLGVGLELSRPARPDSDMFFEGWYEDIAFTKKVTTVPEYDVTLYAKYNGTYLQFNNKGWTETNNSPSLVTDPADPTNKVLKIPGAANSGRNVLFPVYDNADAGSFELKTNTTYKYSFKIKIEAEEGVQVNYTLYRGDSARWAPGSTVRTEISGTSGKCNSAEWVVVSGEFTTGSTHYLEREVWAYQNHLLLSVTSANSFNAYIDDFLIVEQLTEAPEGAVSISFNTNSDEFDDIFGYTGEPVTLPEPTLAGCKFVGWYTDKQLTTPYTATAFGTKSINLYAKWEVASFVCDFSLYEKGVLSERAQFKNDNGNDYIDWSVEYSTNNTNDTETKYRIFLNKDGVHYKVQAGVEYTMTVKYKLLSGNVLFGPVTSAKLNGWSNYVTDFGNDVSITDVSGDEWQTAKITFVAKSEFSGNCDYLSLGVAGHGHVLIDEVTVDAAFSMANIYGSTVYMFNSNGGGTVVPIGGDSGETIGAMPTPTKDGYLFDGWYTDSKLTNAFTATTYGDESLTLYASWILGKFSESYESFPSLVLARGIGGGYKLYNADNITDFDKANVQNGNVSIYRDGSTSGTKAFTLCRDTDLALTVGKQYTVTFYVKPSNVTDAAGTISLIGMSNNTGIASPASTNVVTTVGELKAGEWQKISYTFTADSNYIGISTTAGNDLYFDNFTVTLKGYTGTSTGDASTSPMLIIMMVIVAAGALIVTGKKVFEK